MHRLGHLFHDDPFLFDACRHPNCKAYWNSKKTDKKDAIKKLKPLVSDARTPSAKRSETITDGFLNFSTIENTKPTEEDNFMSDPDQSIKRLNKYPAI